MSDLGLRGNICNFTVLLGSCGLMALGVGGMMEVSVISNSREGLTVMEMSMCTVGLRKGMTDTALKTADCGYLTRRLVDVLQDVFVAEEDAGTDRGLVVWLICEGNEMIEPLYDRLVGRSTMKDVFDPKTGDGLVKRNTLMDEDMAVKIVELGVEAVTICLVFTANTKHGVAVKAYGRNMATGEQVEVGEAVGTVAAQCIGEPGTQLTSCNSVTGGVLGGEDMSQGRSRV